MLIYKIESALKEISISQSFTSCNYTVFHKNIMCDAFQKTLKEFPEEMVEYLSEGSRKHNIQNKVFKNYISLIERSLPIQFSKNGKKLLADDLEDPNLNIFLGMKEFSGRVGDNLKVKNNSDDIYIGGRKASIVKPFYIGKLIDVTSISNRRSILKHVEDYTFTWIKFNGVDPRTEVNVKYLAIPPHYQMGSMVYLNRIKAELKKKI